MKRGSRNSHKIIKTATENNKQFSEAISIETNVRSQSNFGTRTAAVANIVTENSTAEPQQKSQTPGLLEINLQPYPITTKAAINPINVEKLDTQSGKSHTILQTAKSMMDQSAITELQTSYVTSDSVSNATRKSPSQKEQSANNKSTASAGKAAGGGPSSNQQQLPFGLPGMFDGLFEGSGKIEDKLA